MEYNENEWHISQNGHNPGGQAEHVQVPSSLLPDVLHRLGLSPEQALSEIAVDDLVANLKSDDWEVRVAAELCPGIDRSAWITGATLAGAQGLGLAQRIGSLEAGKEADLQVLEWPAEDTADPLEALFEANLRVRLVLVQGSEMKIR